MTGLLGRILSSVIGSYHL